jgi:hypothetical protein
MNEDYDTHLKIIISSGERTRGILYLLGLVTAALMAFFGESDLFNWSSMRHEMISKAYLWRLIPLSQGAPYDV